MPGCASELIGLAAIVSGAVQLPENFLSFNIMAARLSVCPCVRCVCVQSLRVDKQRNKRDELGRTFRLQYNATETAAAENVAGVRVRVKHLLANAPGKAVYQNV